MMILAIEIQQSAYTGMTNDEIAGALNAVSATTRRAVPLAVALAEAYLELVRAATATAQRR